MVPYLHQKLLITLETSYMSLPSYYNKILGGKRVLYTIYFLCLLFLINLITTSMEKIISAKT